MRTLLNNKTMSEISKWYDDYTARQEKVGINARHKSIHNWLLKFGLNKSDSVLEIGCGIGTQTELLLEYLDSNSKVLALDISQKSIEMAKERCSAFKNAEFRASDIIENPVNGQYDVILLPDVIEHIPIDQHPVLFQRLREVVKDSGSVVLHFPQPYYQDWCNVHTPEKMQILDQAIYLDQLVGDSFSAGFHISYLEVYSIWMNPGEYQIVKLSPTLTDYNFEIKVIKPGLAKRGINKIKRIIK